jgi:hypothetical protein
MLHNSTGLLVVIARMLHSSIRLRVVIARMLHNSIGLCVVIVKMLHNSIGLCVLVARMMYNFNGLTVVRVRMLYNSIGSPVVKAGADPEFEVRRRNTFRGRGFGGRPEAPNRCRVEPWWGPRGRSPRKFLNFRDFIGFKICL